MTTTANAFGWKDVWDAVAHWAQETFCFSRGVEVSEPVSDNQLEFDSIQDALAYTDRDVYFIPTWIPDGFTLENVYIDETPTHENYLAVYLNGDKIIKISIKTYKSGRPEQIETSNGLIEILTVCRTDYYLFENYTQIQAVWIADIYECFISGDISIDEIKDMIYSIGKG